MCSPMFCRVPVHFFSTLPLIFTLLVGFSHFLTANFYVFPPTKFVSCFLSNALALLSTSLKTLKFSRTWLLLLVFLSSKSGWTFSLQKVGVHLRFPAEKPRVAFAIPAYWVILYWYACGAEGRAYAHVIIYAQWTNVLTHGAPLRAHEFRQNVCGEPRRQKRQTRPLSRGSHFVSEDLKIFVIT